MVCIMYQQASARAVAVRLERRQRVDGTARYGEGWGLAVSVVAVAASLAIGGYVILPLQALTPHDAHQAQGDLLGRTSRARSIAEEAPREEVSHGDGRGRPHPALFQEEAAQPGDGGEDA